MEDSTQYISEGYVIFNIDLCSPEYAYTNMFDGKRYDLEYPDCSHVLCMPEEMHPHIKDRAFAVIIGERECYEIEINIFLKPFYYIRNIIIQLINMTRIYYATYLLLYEHGGWRFIFSSSCNVLFIKFRKLCKSLFRKK